MELSGRSNLPVFAGRATPLKGNAEFPAEWRKIADELPGVALPTTTRPPSAKSAADYLIEHLKDQKHQVRILALGPLTNLAEALQREPSVARSIQEIVMMGGAVRVPGNLGDGGAFQTSNKTAEWNLFVDPLAARIVFRAHIPIILVPLDATNKAVVLFDSRQTLAPGPYGGLPRGRPRRSVRRAASARQGTAEADGPPRGSRR